MKRPLLIVMIIATFLITSNMLLAEESNQKEEKVVKLEKLTVVAKKAQEPVKLSPEKTIISIEHYKTTRPPQTLVDILRDRAIIDFRGYSDLVQTNDNIYMRGFDTRGFATAIDGVSVEKVGGYRGGHFIDYTIIPFGLIDSIQVNYYRLKATA